MKREVETLRRGKRACHVAFVKNNQTQRWNIILESRSAASFRLCCFPFLVRSERRNILTAAFSSFTQSRRKEKNLVRNHHPAGHDNFEALPASQISAKFAFVDRSSLEEPLRSRGIQWSGRLNWNMAALLFERDLQAPSGSQTWGTM